MSAPPGWYPDPAGQQGQYRFWNGQSWSAAVSPNPAAAPPPTVTAVPSTLPHQMAVPPQRGPGLPPRRTYGWLLALIAAAVVLVVVVALVVARVGRAPRDLPYPADPVGTPTTAVCPAQQVESSPSQSADGQVHGGKLSFPRLASPWSAPRPEHGVAFARAVSMQTVLTEPDSPRPWYAAVMVGQLSAGDGFFSPRDGAAIVVKCVTGTFYGNAVVTRDDQRNQAVKVDGHAAWKIESQLHFDVPGVEAKQELLIVVIVDTGDGEAGLFYASIPQNAPKLVQPARTALAALQVDG